MTSKKPTRKDKVCALLKQGKSPKDISQLTGDSFKKVMEYLLISVGEGIIRRSDIWFSINHDISNVIEEYEYVKEKQLGKEEEARALENVINILSNHIDEFKLYLKLKDARVAHGDMYELISDIELLLHRSIKVVLIRNYGSSELEWWRNGVPLSVRIECAKRYGEDNDPAREKYC